MIDTNSLRVKKQQQSSRFVTKCRLPWQLSFCNWAGQSLSSVTRWKVNCLWHLLQIKLTYVTFLNVIQDLLSVWKTSHSWYSADCSSTSLLAFFPQRIWQSLNQFPVWLTQTKHGQYKPEGPLQKLFQHNSETCRHKSILPVNVWMMMWLEELYRKLPTAGAMSVPCFQKLRDLWPNCELWSEAITTNVYKSNNKYIQWQLR